MVHDKLAAEVAAGPAMERFFEDFAVGQVFHSGRIKVDADQIKAFAVTYDPQPFHLDEEAARGTFFDGLAASGWQTAALTMRLLVTSDIRPAGGFIGTGEPPRVLRRLFGLSQAAIAVGTSRLA